ncbi:hypothetical protein GTZ89_36185 [Streptomyces sp. SID8382]|uniref:hypothetical protein n=1 Tax=Streptomyces malaysiensis TaxID=92644 RepID=UPI000CA33651|nr:MULTISPECIES: hypothetical protein [unclassified Streptomyces]AUA08910.1 hypothetical protein CFP59_00998 [Streptomyces sp. M56]MYX60937.1 hypothetical protein [Streptomyces sp. SID8382]
MNARQRMALVAAAAVLGGGLAAAAPASASAQSGWTAKGYASDVAGAHASGKVYTRGDGRVQLTGTLKDTKTDGKYAILQISAKYVGGGSRYEYDVTGSSKSIGSAGGYNFASSVRSIKVQECIGHSGGSGHWYLDKCGSGWHEIW